MTREPQLLACSGVLHPPEGFTHVEVQIWQAGQPAGVPRPRTCLIATATGDALEQIGKWHEPVPTFGGYEPSHLPFVEPDGDGGSRETAVPARRWVP